MVWDLYQDDIKNQRYTVTLIRGRLDINGYRAYERMLPDTINDLITLVNNGEVAQEKVVKYVDKLVTTWSPKSVELEQYEVFYFTFVEISMLIIQKTSYFFVIQQ